MRKRRRAPFPSSTNSAAPPSCGGAAGFARGMRKRRRAPFPSSTNSAAPPSCGGAAGFGGSVRSVDAVVPAAGLGTRMLPLTHAVPKELLPLDGRPIIEHVVDELLGAGIERVWLVTRPGK